MRTRLMMLAALAALLVWMPAHGAGMVTVQLDEIAVLTPPAELEDSARCLLSFELPQVLDDVTIDYARLTASAQITSPEEDQLPPLVVEAYAVTSSWSAASVAWSPGWDSPGGDFETHAGATFVAVPDSTVSISLDLTHIVQDWVDDDASNYGVIVILPVGIGHEISAVDQQTHPPVLEVYYSGRE